jgi:hypothetical protein
VTPSKEGTHGSEIATMLALARVQASRGSSKLLEAFTDDCARLVTHADHLLSCSGMHAQRAVKVRLCCSCFERNRNALHDLWSIRPHMVTPYHSIAVSMDDELYQRALVAASECIAHRLELGNVHVKCADIVCDALCLCQAHSGHRWLAEDLNGRTTVADVANV